MLLKIRAAIFTLCQRIYILYMHLFPRVCVQLCLFLFSSKDEPSAEGVAKIFEKLCHKWKKKLKLAFPFFYLNRDLQPKALQKFLKNWSHKWKKNKSICIFFHLNRDLQPKALQKYLKSCPTNGTIRWSMLTLFFLSKQRPSAEGAAKIFEKLIPQMEKK